MIVLICVAVLAAWGAIAAMVSATRDGYRRIPTAPTAR